MTVATGKNVKIYAGNGATTVFAYDFRILDEDDLVVSEIDADGAVTVLTKTTDYTVSGVGLVAGGNVTVTTATPTGTNLVIRRSFSSFLQDLDLRNQGDFFIETIEDMLDKVVMYTQQLRTDAENSLRLLDDESRFDAGGKKLGGLANATESDQAVAYGQINGQADAAAASAVAAAASAVTAEGHADDAATSAAAAAASAASLDLPTITGGDALKLLRVNAAGDAYEFGETYPALTAPAAYTVGPTGDYASINAALADLTIKYPAYASPRVLVTLTLEAAYVMQEQVIVESLDLSWITIYCATTVTIERDKLTAAPFGGGIYPAFCAINGGKLPLIYALFEMDTSGTASGRTGVALYGGSYAKITPLCGVTQAAAYGLYVSSRSTAVAANADFSSTLATHCAYVIESTASLDGADLSGATSQSLFAARASTVSAQSAVVTGTGAKGIVCASNSSVYAGSANATGRTTGFEVGSGGLMNATSATGTLSKTANTVGADGIIFQ